jgi:hypothetical protein
MQGAAVGDVQLPAAIVATRSDSAFRPSDDSDLG